MSARTRLIISLVAGFDAGLLVLVLLLIFNPGGLLAGNVTRPGENNIRLAQNLTNPTPVFEPDNGPSLAFTSPVGGKISPLRTSPLSGPIPTPRPASSSQPVAPPSLGIIPARLKIPRLGIEAKIEQVGLDKQGRPDVPRDYSNAAWLKVSSKPGEIGNAVIDGHLDSPTAPAIFFNLKDLKVGERVYVLDAAGQQRVFEVVETAVYPYDQAPLDRIFGDSTEARLNLITCTGAFNYSTENYDRRFVAYTRLVN